MSRPILNIVYVFMYNHHYISIRYYFSEKKIKETEAHRDLITCLKQSKY